MELLTSSLLQGQLVNPSLEKRWAREESQVLLGLLRKGASISSPCILSPHSWLTESRQPTQFLLIS